MSPLWPPIAPELPYARMVLPPTPTSLDLLPKFPIPFSSFSYHQPERGYVLHFSVKREHDMHDIDVVVSGSAKSESGVEESENWCSKRRYGSGRGGGRSVHHLGAQSLSLLRAAVFATLGVERGKPSSVSSVGLSTAGERPR